MNVPFTTGPVTDFVWQHGWCLPAKLPDREDSGELRGQFALHGRDDDGSHVLMRDRLGVNKLFFTVTPAGDVESSNYLADLLGRGHPLANIWSVPSGHTVCISPAKSGTQGAYRLYPHALPSQDAAPATSFDALVAGIREAWAATFVRLAEILGGRRVFVTLSGGLDSTVVALLAREHLGDVTAVTFTTGEATVDGDLAFARKVARHVGIPIEVVHASSAEIVALLDTVLVHGQDWRDFNVHCGLVNAALGQGLRALLGDDAGRPRSVLLTGDVMNELTADYGPVRYGGITHYALPRVPMARLRRSLVAGLDSGDREVGILNAFGFDVIQPYALSADAVAAVPSTFLEQPRAKQALIRGVMGDRVPAVVYDRPKVRAQAGSPDVGGTLAALVDRGIDGPWLKTRFAELLGVEARSLDSLIRGGVYRSTPTAPWEVAKP